MDAVTLRVRPLWKRVLGWPGLVRRHRRLGLPLIVCMRLANLTLALLGLVLAACAHRPPILPRPGIDVDVRVHVGSKALEAGGAEPTRCSCCTGAVCRCVGKG